MRRRPRRDVRKKRERQREKTEPPLDQDWRSRGENVEREEEEE